MSTSLFLIPLAAVFQVAPQEQEAPTAERKVRIEVVTTENGETKRVTKELDASDERQVQDALREMGVMSNMRLGDGERDMTIEIHGFGEDEDGDAFVHVGPLPPMPPMAPGAPTPPVMSICDHSAYLGVSTIRLNDDLKKKSGCPESDGAYVTEVVDDAPATKLGLQEGDVITAIDDDAITGPQSLMERVKAHEPGDKVKVTWYRNGKKMHESVELGERKEMSYAYAFGDGSGEGFDMDALKELEGLQSFAGEPRAFLGVEPGDASEEVEGALIGGITEGSAAEKMGVHEGDIIRSVNGKAISSFDALAEVIGSMKPGEEARIGIKRGNDEMSLKGELGQHEAQIFINGEGFDAHALRGLEGHGMNGLAPGEREEFRREMDELRREMDELRREMGNGVKREVHVRVEARPLTDDEKSTLRKKGVAVDSELKVEGLRAFPNPSNGFYRIQFDMADRGDLAVDVHDSKGDRVYQERITGFKGRYERTLDLSDQATGNYFLVITQGGRTATTKLVKE